MLTLLAALYVAVVAQALPFETTTDVTVYPIQWYFLKIDGTYLYSYAGELRAGSGASSSDDAYLWCFVTTSQGKTVLYNKQAKQFPYEGWYFSTNRYKATVDYVEYTSGSTFYICFMDGNTKYYLDAYDDGLWYTASKGSSTSAVKALYEGLIEPTGTLIFPDPTVYDDHCVIEYDYYPGEGDSGSELRLYVNGQWVSMPYYIGRTAEAQTVEARANVIFVNPRIRPVDVTKTFVIPALPPAASPIVTTPAPTRLPIHWYQLRVNDKYIYYDPNGGIGNSIKMSTTPSTDDNFLWCFVKISAEKTLIYNRAAKCYVAGCQFLTTNINHSLISYIEHGSDNYFYITYYHDGDNRLYYLYESIGDGYDVLASTVKSLASAFCGIEILVEKGETATGDVNGDGNVNTGDVSTLYGVILGTETDEDVIARAKINDDDEVNAGDISMLYGIILGQN